MIQDELFEKKSKEQLGYLVNDLIRRGLNHSNLSKPVLQENIDALDDLNKKWGNKTSKDDEYFRIVTVVKKWIQEGAEIDDYTGYRIANLGTKEALDVALSQVSPHAKGKGNFSIAERVFARHVTYVPYLLEHADFKWEREDVAKLIGSLIDKKAHAPISKLLNSGNDGFNLLKSKEDRDLILNKFVGYVDGSPRSSSVDFNSGRLVDIFFTDQWDMSSISDKLDKSHWGKALKIMLEERWMNENIPEKEANVSKGLKF